MKNFYVSKLYLFDLDNDLIKELIFEKNKINLIIGDSKTGKTQILECIKYALGASGANIEKELLGKILKNIVLEVNIDGKTYTLLREYKLDVEKNTKIKIFDGAKDVITAPEIEDYIPENISYLHKLLESTLPLPHNIKQISNVVNAKNILKYSFLPYNEVTNVNHIIENENFHFSDYQNLNLFIQGVFQDDKVKDEISSILTTQDATFYEQNKQDIKEARLFLKAISGRSGKINYEEEALNFFKCGPNSYYNLLEVRYKELETNYANLIMNEIIYEEMTGLAVDKSVSTIVKDFLCKKLKSDTANGTLQKVIENEMNIDFVDEYKQDLSLSILNKQQQLEDEIKTVKSQIKNLKKKIINVKLGEDESAKEVVEFLVKISNQLHVLDYKSVSNYTGLESVKSAIQEIETYNDKQITYNLSQLQRENIQAGYKIKTDELMAGDFKAVNTGSSFVHACRKISTLLALHQNSKCVFNFLMIDQPLSALSDSGETEDKTLKQYWDGLINILFTSQSIEPELTIQPIIIEKEDNVYKNAKYRISMQDQIKIHQVVNLTNNKLISAEMLAKHSLKGI